MSLLARIIYTILFIILLFVIKPNIIFKPNGLPRHFGFGHDKDGYKKTMYNIQLIIFIFILILNHYSINN